MQGPAIFWHWWQNSVRELVNDLDVMGEKTAHEGLANKPRARTAQGSVL